jgi:hypothetical protein
MLLVAYLFADLGHLCPDLRNLKNCLLIRGVTMKKTLLLIALPCLLTMTTSLALHAEEITIAYEYAQNPQVDFAKATKGPLKVANFTDARSVSDPRQFAENLIEAPVSEVVNDALVQAFVAGGASLVDSGENLTLEGQVTEVAVAEKDGGFEVTIRTHITLKRGSQTAFDTVIFGRAADTEIEQAVRATLDKLVNSLILDDYFLMEIL